MKKRISAQRYFQRQTHHPKPQSHPPAPTAQTPSPSSVPANQQPPPAPQPSFTAARSSTPLDTRHPALDTLPHPRHRRARGRPTKYTEDLADAIYEAIRLYGHTDTAAAAKYGVRASTVSRWKRENEDFATDLEAARAEFKETILAEIRGATKRDGTLDWRAHAWILERTFPDEYGRRTRKPPEPVPYAHDREPIDPERVLEPELIQEIKEEKEAELRDPENWYHKQMEIRAQALFEELKAAYLAQNPTDPNLQ